MLRLQVFVVVLLLALPFAAIGLGNLFGWAERKVEQVRARRVGTARRRVAPGSAQRGHTRGRTSEHLRGGHWR